MISIKDIAKKAQVSVSTVSRAINKTGYVSIEANERIEKAIKELNYQPNHIARSLVKQKSNILGVMVAQLRTPFINSIEAESKKLGYNVILCHTKEDIDYEKDYLRILIERRVDGVIILPVCREYKHLKEASRLLPMVFVGRTVDNVDINSVEVDNFFGSIRIIEHLVELGHRRIGIINGPMFISTGKKRWEGIQYAFHKNNIEIDNSIVKEGDYSIEGGYEKTLEILKEKNRPTAIFAANHQTSIGVFKALKENKIKVPEEMAIAAFDGFDGPYREYEFLVEPKITSNVHPSDDMGTTAVDLLHKSIQSKMKNKYIPSKNNVHIVIETKFEPRQSTIGSYPGVNAK